VSRECYKFRDKLVAYVAVCNILFLIGYVVDLGFVFQLGGDLTRFPSNVCTVTGIAITWFSLSEVLWSTAISFYMYMSVVHSIKTQKYERYFHLTCWGLPIFAASVSSAIGFEMTQPCCFVADANAVFYLFYLWVILASLAIIFMYIRMLWCIYWTTVIKNKTRRGRVFKRLAIYPFFFMVVYVPGLINRLHNFIYPDSPRFALYVLHATFVPLNGVLNCLFFLSYMHVTKFTAKFSKQGECIQEVSPMLTSTSRSYV